MAEPPAAELHPFGLKGRVALAAGASHLLASRSIGRSLLRAPVLPNGPDGGPFGQC